MQNQEDPLFLKNQLLNTMNSKLKNRKNSQRIKPLFIAPGRRSWPASGASTTQPLLIAPGRRSWPASGASTTQPRLIAPGRRRGRREAWLGLWGAREARSQLAIWAEARGYPSLAARRRQ